MRVLVWILVWVTLVLLAIGYLFVQVRATWRLTRAFGRELGEASDRLSAVQEQMGGLGRANEAIQELAVFESPRQARAERASVRRSLRRERDGRRSRTPVGPAA